MAEVIQAELVVQSRLDAVAGVRRWATQKARAAGFDKDATFAVELALTEALANVIRHAYGGDEGQEVRLSLIIDDEKLSLTIRDFGQKFEPSSYTPPDLSVPGEGGYGVFLIHELMDDVVYDTSPPRGTRLTMVKYRPQR